MGAHLRDFLQASTVNFRPFLRQADCSLGSTRTSVNGGKCAHMYKRPLLKDESPALSLSLGCTSRTYSTSVYLRFIKGRGTNIYSIHTHHMHEQFYVSRDAALGQTMSIGPSRFLLSHSSA